MPVVAAGEVLTGLQRRHVGHDAGEGGVNHGVRELTRGLVARGDGILVFGMVFDRRVGVAVEIGGDAGKLLLAARQASAANSASVLRAVSIGGLGRKIVGDQLLLALEVDRVEVDILLRLFDLGLHVAVAGLQRHEIVPRISDLGIGAIQRQLKLLADPA